MPPVFEFATTAELKKPKMQVLRLSLHLEGENWLNSHTFQQEEGLFTAQFTRNGGLKSKRWIRLEEAFVLSCGLKQKTAFFFQNQLAFNKFRRCLLLIYDFSHDWRQS